MMYIPPCAEGCSTACSFDSAIEALPEPTDLEALDVEATVNQARKLAGTCALLRSGILQAHYLEKIEVDL